MEENFMEEVVVGAEVVSDKQQRMNGTKTSVEWEDVDAEEVRDC